LWNPGGNKTKQNKAKTEQNRTKGMKIKEGKVGREEGI
jgi:hypothetical protein